MSTHSVGIPVEASRVTTWQRPARGQTLACSAVHTLGCLCTCSRRSLFVCVSGCEFVWVWASEYVSVHRGVLHMSVAHLCVYACASESMSLSVRCCLGPHTRLSVGTQVLCASMMYLHASAHVSLCVSLASENECVSKCTIMHICNFIMHAPSSLP